MAHKNDGTRRCGLINDSLKVGCELVDAMTTAIATFGQTVTALVVKDHASQMPQVAALVAAQPRIDALICNAGFGIYGTIDTITPVQMRLLMDVNFHGTSTHLNDAVEARCVRRVFNGHADRLAGSSVKSMIGHPQGASGAAGVVTTALALATGILPPTINLRRQDPDCDLDVIPNHARRGEVEAALCNCLGFGSKNSALVLGRA